MILLIVCAALLVAAFVFGARGTVEVFGFNIYIAQTDEFEAVGEGSAVFVKRCEPYDLNDGNLILYYDELSPTLGYVDEVSMEDGSYIITVSDSSASRTIPVDAFVGKADTSSAFLGAIIKLARQPVGVLVMAVLPCVALVIYDILRARKAAQPIPEVEPLYKNADEDKPTSAKGISVKPDGNAQYSRRTEPTGDNNSADKVLFTYGSANRTSLAGKQRAQNNHDIIPLTDRTAQTAEKAAEKPRNITSEKSRELKVYPNRTTDASNKSKSAKSAESTRAAENITAAKTPSSVAARKYLDSAVQSNLSATAELPDLPKKQKKDAFFPQTEPAPRTTLVPQTEPAPRTTLVPHAEPSSSSDSAQPTSAPQIGRQKSARRVVVELEDALSTARTAERSSSAVREYSGKKSAAMIASRSAALFTEDDDSRDRERYEVDDILAGLEKRNNK